jgi:NADH-quinone oxidoreductase subunit D
MYEANEKRKTINKQVSDTATHTNIKLPEGSIEKQTTTLNLGPTHPATHGVFQNILEMDGERIISAEQTVGYIHRAFEKLLKEGPSTRYYAYGSDELLQQSH